MLTGTYKIEYAILDPQGHAASTFAVCGESLDAALSGSLTLLSPHAAMGRNIQLLGSYRWDPDAYSYVRIETILSAMVGAAEEPEESVDRRSN